MQFHSYIFIFAFLPVSVLGYFLLNRWRHEAGKLWLIVSGIAFYLYGGLNTATCLAVSILLNIAAAEAIVRKPDVKKAVFVAAIAVNVISLAWFKYRGFFAADAALPVLSRTRQELVLPLGVSFFTFQQIAWLCDVYHHILL